MENPFDYIKARAANRRLAKFLEASARKAQAAQRPLALDPLGAELIDRCIINGATCHLQPGAVDRLALAPEIAYKLMSHGAVPTQGLLDELLAWTQRSLFVSWCSEHVGSEPSLPIEWLQKLVDTTLESYPLLDWNRVTSDSAGHDLENLLSRQLEPPFRGLFNKVDAARRRIGLNPWPLSAPPSFYTDLMFIALDPNTTMSGRPRWMTTGRQALVAELLDLGADPNARRDIRGTVAHLKDSPAITWAMGTGHECVEDMIRHGAVVDEQTIKTAMCVVFDGQFGSESKGDLKELPFEQILLAYPGKIDWSMRVPSSDYSKVSLKFCINKRFPGMRQRVDAIGLNEEMQSTVAPAPADHRRVGPRF